MNWNVFICMLVEYFSGSKSIACKSLLVTYRQISNTRHTLLGNKIVDHSDAVGASPVGAAPTSSSFST